IQYIDYRGQRLAEEMAHAFHGRSGVFTAFVIACNDFLQRTLLSAIHAAVMTFQGRAGQNGFHASGTTAITGASRFVQEIVPPFARDSLQAGNHFSVPDDAAAYARWEERRVAQGSR